MKKFLILASLFVPKALLSMDAQLVLHKQQQLLAAIEKSGAERNAALETIKELIKEGGVSLNYRYPERAYSTPLMLTVKQGNLEAAKLLCKEAMVDPNIADELKNTPLHAAMWGLNDAGLLMIRLLADKGSMMDRCLNNEWQSPLQVAISALNLNQNIVPNRVLALIALGSHCYGTKIDDFSVTTSLGFANHHPTNDGILLDACFLDNKGILYPGCRLDANPNAKDKIYGMTPLMWPAARGHFALAKLLLSDPKIDVNATDNFGDTALHYAARNGHWQLVQLLLDNPTIIGNIKNNNGTTPLDLAKLRDHKKVGRILVDEVIRRNRKLFLIFTRRDNRTPESSLPLLPTDVAHLTFDNPKPIGADRRGFAKIIRLCQKPA